MRCCHSSLLYIENKSLSPLRIKVMGDWIAMLLRKKVKTLCRMVDWSGAAHQGVGGTEINLSPCKVAFSAIDIIFFYFTYLSGSTI